LREHIVFIFMVDDGNDMLLRNTGNHIQDHTSQHTFAPQRKSQILKGNKFGAS
jgi:hypothetical protein